MLEPLDVDDPECVEVCFGQYQGRYTIFGSFDAVILNYKFIRKYKSGVLKRDPS